MKIALPKTNALGGLFRSHDETFCLKETRNAIDVVLVRLKRMGSNSIGQAEHYTNQGDYSASLKELNLLYNLNNLQQNESLVELLYQAWESYAQYRYHRTERAKRNGSKSLVDSCEEKGYECERGRTQVWHWRNACFTKNSPMYFRQALHLVQSVPLFSDLTDGHVLPGILAPHMQRRIIPPGRHIWKDFADPEGVYFLESGEVLIYKELFGHNPDPKIVSAPNYIGEGPILMGMKHSSYCKARKECVLYVIEADTFIALVGQFEGAKHRLVLDSAKRIKSEKSRREVDAIEERKIADKVK